MSLPLRLGRRVSATAAWLLYGVALSSCSSTPAAPTMSTIVLSITGPTTLATGLSSQMGVSQQDGTAVTGSVSWVSTTPAVATVSPTGLVTAVGPGQTVVVATSGAAIGRATLTVQTASTAAVTLSKCGFITTPGQYVLAADLTNSPSEECVTVAAAAVSLDCGSHVLDGLVVDHAVSVSIAHCMLSAAFQVADSQLVTISDSTIAPTAANEEGAQTISSSNVIFQRDHIVTHGALVTAGIYFRYGNHNQVQQSTFEGGYDGGKANAGTDDGIVLMSEANDDIEGDTFTNFFDQGVEGVDAVTMVTIANNTFTNIGSAAVGSYWCTNWTGNIIRGNTVTQSATLSLVGYNTGTVCGSGGPPSGFTNNQFVGNTFRMQTAGTLGGSTGPTVPGGPAISIAMKGAVSGNLLANNDFGPNEGIFVAMPSGYIDGGGNICGPSSETNIPCSGGG